MLNKLSLLFVFFTLLSGCIAIPDYRGPNARGDEVAFGIPVSETTYPATLNTGNLAVRYDLKLSKEVFYKGAEKNEETALQAFRLDRNTSAALKDFQFQGAYPSHVADYDYNFSEPALTGIWAYNASACQLDLRSKSGDLLLQLQGRKGEYTLDYKQGGPVTEPVMVFEIVEQAIKKPELIEKPQLEALWQRGLFYSQSEFVRCDGL